MLASLGELACTLRARAALYTDARCIDVAALRASRQQPSSPAVNSPQGQQAIGQQASALRASRQQPSRPADNSSNALSWYCLVIGESWGAGALAEGDSG